MEDTCFPVNFFLFKREQGAWGEEQIENTDAVLMSQRALVWGLFLYCPGHFILHRMRISCSAFRLGFSCEKSTIISSFFVTFFWG